MSRPDFDSIPADGKDLAQVKNREVSSCLSVEVQGTLANLSPDLSIFVVERGSLY